MSPREKHVPDDALRTSVSLTAEDRAAIRWIGEVRRANGSRRVTINDILVDALWYFLEKSVGRTREQIQVTVPPRPVKEQQRSKVTQIRNRKSTI